MRFKNNAIVVLGIALLGACSNEVIFTDEYSPQLVLNSVSEANQPIKINLNHDVALFDTLINDYDFRDRYSVDGALVLLFENDVLVDTMRNGSYKSEYVSDIVAKENTKYTIQASHPKYPTAQASTVIPQVVPIKTFQYEINADSSWMRLHITLSDPSSTDVNYYSFNMYRLRREKFKTHSMLYNTDPVFGKVPELDFNSLSVSDEYATGESSIMFSDEYSKTKDLTIQADIRLKMEDSHIYPNGNPSNIKLNDTLVVELNALHPDIYKYNKTMKMYDRTQTSNLEPINVHSNVQNGMGLVSGVSVHQLVFYYK